jgi:hypothetical protein
MTGAPGARRPAAPSACSGSRHWHPARAHHAAATLRYSRQDTHRRTGLHALDYSLYYSLVLLGAACWRGAPSETAGTGSSVDVVTRRSPRRQEVLSLQEHVPARGARAIFLPVAERTPRAAAKQMENEDEPKPLLGRAALKVTIEEKRSPHGMCMKMLVSLTHEHLQPFC